VGATKPFLFAGGGTGGHVYPGIALARSIEERRPNASIVWIGTADRVEARAVPAAGYRFETLDVAFLKGRRGLDLARACGRLPGALYRAAALVAQIDPCCVIGLGGFVSGPVAAVAATRGIPLFLLEQNATPGMTNRIAARGARRVYATFEASRDHLPKGKVEVLGNPVRPDLRTVFERRQPRRPMVPRVLVFGGSQGARTLNRAMPTHFGTLKRDGLGFEVWHATGVHEVDAVSAAYREAGVEARVTPYIDDMAAAYAWADLAVCRAGATSIAELTVVGLPAIYVPFPFAADDHQTANALAVVEAGGGVLIPDDEFSTARVVNVLGPLLRFPETLGRMGQAARVLARPDAADRITDDLLSRLE